MEPHLCNIARMWEIAAMIFDKDEGCSYSPPRICTKCCRNSGGYYAMDSALSSTGADRSEGATGSG